jgi:ATP-binding cassette, subfamily B, bacterial
VASLNILCKYLKFQWSKIALLALLLLTGMGLQLIIPQLLRRFIDASASNAPSKELFASALLFIGLAMGGQLISALATYVAEVVAWASTNRLRSDLILHCLYLDISFHNDRTPGELIERTDGDINTLANLFSKLVILVFGNALLLVCILALLFREDSRLGLMLTGFVAVALILLSGVRDLAVPYWVSEREANTELLGFLEERLSGIEDIRSSGAAPHALRLLYQLMRALLQQSMKAYLMVITVLGSTLGVFSLGTIISLGMGAYLLKAKVITVGAVYLIFHYTQLLRYPLEQLLSQVGALAQARASVERIQGLFETRSVIQSGEAVDLQSGPLSLELENVCFRYGKAGGEAALQDFSFYFRAGSVTALLGRTGSGKSTLIRLLSRLYEPACGDIRVNNLDIRQISIPTLRRRIGVVTQEVQLFHGSVRDNLTVFDPGVSDERILEVLNDLGLSWWYDLLPEGLDTELKSQSAGLSAGEAQLLAFARAFLRDPDLVILDEASSRLDPVTEQLIRRTMDKLLEERPRTSIIIAHRLSTVQRADDIIILDNGRIVERGARVSLMNDPDSRFYHLLQTGLREALP